MQDWCFGETVNLLSIATPLGPTWEICSAQSKLEGAQGPQHKGSPMAISLKNMDFVLKAMGSYWKLLSRGETGCNLSMVSRQLFTLYGLHICLSKYCPPSAGIHVFFKTHLPCEILPGNTNPFFSSMQHVIFFSPVSLMSLHIFFQCKHYSSIILHPGLYKLFMIEGHWDYRRQILYVSKATKFKTLLFAW